MGQPPEAKVGLAEINGVIQVSNSASKNEMIGFSKPLNLESFIGVWCFVSCNSFLIY